VRGLNKTDAVTLLTTFGAMQDILKAGMTDLRLCPGFGEAKADRLFRAFNEPFIPDHIRATHPKRFETPSFQKKAQPSRNPAEIADPITSAGKTHPQAGLVPDDDLDGLDLDFDQDFDVVDEDRHGIDWENDLELRDAFSVDFD
jgi:DNA excision repair protein ERCC-1